MTHTRLGIRLATPATLTLAALACGASLLTPRLSAQSAPPAGGATPAAAAQAATAPAADEALVKKARAIHEHVITLDTHNDIEPANFTVQRNYLQDLPTQVNLPKMIKGGLDASFFIVYVG